MWYNSIEFYVIAGAIAAGAVAAAAIPQRRGQSVLHMAAGELSRSDDAAPLPPAIDVEVGNDGIVKIRRTGLTNITDNGAASLAINVIGFDVNIEERLTPGNGAPGMDTAVFALDFFAPERYHVKYNSEDAGVFAAFTLNATPGIRIHRPLK